jgi:hypothetical protein
MRRVRDCGNNDQSGAIAKQGTTPSLDIRINFNRHRDAIETKA